MFSEMKAKIVGHRIPGVLSVLAAALAMLGVVVLGEPPMRFGFLDRVGSLRSHANADVFTLAPNPMPVCDGSGNGQALLTWNIGASEQYEVRQGSTDGQVVATGIGSASRQLTSIAADTTFVLLGTQTTYTHRFNRKTRQWERVPVVQRIERGRVVARHTRMGCTVVPPVSQGEPLIVATSHSLVQPGGYYILYASERVGTNIRSYTGQLDYKLSFCPKQTPNQCSESGGPWLAVQNGQVRADVPVGTPQGIYKAQFKPSDRPDGPWSNQVQVNVGPRDFTYGLEDMKQYWILPDTEKQYVGKNHITGAQYEAVVGYRSVPAVNACSWMPADTKEMYFMKTDRDGYWGPNYNDPMIGADGRNTLSWYVVPHAQRDGWDNEYLTAVGHRAFELPAQSSERLQIDKNFKKELHAFMYGSLDTRYPGYILAPRWVGSGYGVANLQQTYIGTDSAGGGLCELATTNRPRGVGTWVVHVDKVNLSLPKYQGPAMRISFWEYIGIEIKEQWYFVKGVGLVRIEQKVYKPGQCSQDVDCFNKDNPTMLQPMAEMTLKQYMQ